MPALQESSRTGIVTILVFLTLASILISAVSAQTSNNLPRGSRFSITITGQPNTPYYVWDAGTFSLSGAPGDQPPVILETQNVQKDPSDGPYVIGSHVISGSGGKTILEDVTPSTPEYPVTNYYALVTTDANGQAIVELSTSSNTAARHFAIKVEDQGGNPGQLQVTSQLFPRTTPPTTEVPTSVPAATAPPVVTTTIPTPVTTIPATLTTVPTTQGVTRMFPTIPTPVPAGICVIAFCIAALFIHKRT